MLIGSELLVAARGWTREAQNSWEGTTIVSRFEESPEGLFPRSVSWILEGPNFMGQIVIWEDGRSELDMITVATDEARCEYRKVDSRDKLQTALSAVRDWVVRDSSE